MKPQPRPRRTPNVPKAAGPDPAALTASSAAIAGNTSNNANASKNSKVGSATDTQKITIRIPAELAGRARSVWRLESADPDAPFRTYSELIADWIEAGVTEAEQRLNDGRPLPPTPVGQIPRGRPPVKFN